MRQICGAIWLCFLALGGARAASPSSATAIPFEYCCGFLWIQVQSPASARPLNFLFDTGASVSVIDAGTAKQLHLKTGNPVGVRGVNAALTGSWAAGFTASAAGVALPADYLSLDLSKLAQSCGRSLDGLVGADFIRGRVVEIDFASHQLRLLEKASPAVSDTVLPLKVCHGAFCVAAGVNHQTNQWVRLDTGCATALQWVSSAVSTRGSFRKPAVGLAAFSIPQAATTVFLGDRRFDGVPTGIHRRAIFAGESGLLGNGMLERFRTVTIDTKSERLILGLPFLAN